MTPKDECEQLMNTLLPAVQHLLEKTMSFILPELL